MSRRERVKLRGDRPSSPARSSERRQQAAERSILAREQDGVFPAEIVIKVGGRHFGGSGNVAHAGGGKTARAEGGRRGSKDFETAPFSPSPASCDTSRLFRTAVR